MSSTMENRSLSAASINRPASPSYQTMHQRNSIFKSNSEYNATARVDANATEALDATQSTIVVGSGHSAGDGDPLSLRNGIGQTSFLMGVKPPPDSESSPIVDQPLASPRAQVPSPSRHTHHNKMQTIGGVQCCESEGADSEDDGHATSGSLREDGRLMLRRRNSQSGALLFAPAMTSLIPTNRTPVRRADSSRSSGSIAVTNSGGEAFHLA